MFTFTSNKRERDSNEPAQGHHLFVNLTLRAIWLFRREGHENKENSNSQYDGRLCCRKHW